METRLNKKMLCDMIDMIINDKIDLSLKVANLKRELTDIYIENQNLKNQINFDLQTQLSKLKKDRFTVLNNKGQSNIRCYFVLFYFIFFAVIAISMI